MKRIIAGMPALHKIIFFNEILLKCMLMCYSWKKGKCPVSEEIRFFPEQDFEPSVSNAESQTVIIDVVYSST